LTPLYRGEGQDIRSIGAQARPGLSHEVEQC
jgi:hypothetical protein